MSLGATRSAPASAWLTAVRESSSRLRSLSTSPSTTTPQWPCDVYSQRQTSVSTTSSGKRGRSARSACWTMPSSSQAPVASSSFSTGTPKSMIARTPLPTRVATSRTSPSRSTRVLAGSASFASGSGATKSGITNWSSASRVSRTSPRRVAVRRKRRSRVMGNELTLERVRRDRLCGRRGRRLGHGRLGLPRLLEADLHEWSVRRPLLELDSLGEELPRCPAGREQRQGDEDSRKAVELAARQQAEDHEQRMEPQRAAHHLRHDDVSLELLDAEEEERDPERRERVLDEGVEHRRSRAEPRPDVGNELRHAGPGAECRRVLPAVRHQPEQPEDPKAHAATHADDQREEELALDVARHRLLHPHDQPAATVRREAPIHRVGQTLHVEQHVDGDDDDENRVEEERDDRESCSFRPVQRLRRVLLDVLRPDLVEERLALLLHVDAAQVVVIEPDLEAAEILLGARAGRVSGIDRKVVVDPVG